jgi:hypothetical protein
MTSHRKTFGFGAVCMLAATAWITSCGRESPVQSDTLEPIAPHAVNGIFFENVAEAAGIGFCFPQQPHPMRIKENVGGGCAFLDYDNDGWMDILFIGTAQVALYRNLGNGRFEDVSAATGMDRHEGFWMGCAVGDYDGDGRQDILLVGYHRLALMHNVTGRRFEDATVRAGLDPNNNRNWSLSAGFMDLDGSGHLALVLTNYVDFGPKDIQYCEVTPGVRSGCPVTRYRPEFTGLWKNPGNGRFRNVTAPSGMGDTHGRAMDLAFADMDNDGRMDIYIGNDGTPAELMRNLGGMRFRNVGMECGIAFGPMGRPVSAMGSDWGDYDRDGKLDLATSAFSDEPYSLFQNLGRGLFGYVSESTGIFGPTFRTLGFGTKWVDVDNDGWPDLVFSNGHVYDNAEQIDSLLTFRQPLQLFHNEPGRNGRWFCDLVPLMNGNIARPIVGRGLATGDFDNDGRMDLLVVDFEGKPLLLHNATENRNHWITLDLRSDGPNHFAYGARVTARAGTRTWVADVSPASAFASSSDPRIHFGLGDAARLDSLVVRWPDGRKEVLRDIPSDRFLIILKGRGIVKEGVGNRG